MRLVSLYPTSVMQVELRSRHEHSVSLRVFAHCTALFIATVGCSSITASRCPPVPPTTSNAAPVPAWMCNGSNVPGERARIELQGAIITVDMDPTEFEIESDVIWKWISDAARAVTSYYGHFPVPQCHLQIVATNGHGARWGQANAHPKEPRILIRLGRNTRAEDLADDWTLTHEMVHLAFPNMQPSHLWIEEGLATYIEPIARFKMGLVTEKAIWLDWMTSMPQGQPDEGDRGLDFTRTWGRVYWGGALFALVADVGIRRASDNRTGLRQALQGIVDAGGTMKTWWHITDAFAIGDRVTHTNVLMSQYQRMRAAPAPVNLEELWTQLGVRLENGRVVLDDHAPQAAIRKSILRD